MAISGMTRTRAIAFLLLLNGCFKTALQSSSLPSFSSLSSLSSSASSSASSLSSSASPLSSSASSLSSATLLAPSTSLASSTLLASATPLASSSLTAFSPPTPTALILPTLSSQEPSPNAISSVTNASSSPAVAYPIVSPQFNSSSLISVTETVWITNISTLFIIQNTTSYLTLYTTTDITTTSLLRKTIVTLNIQTSSILHYLTFLAQKTVDQTNYINNNVTTTTTATSIQNIITINNIRVFTAVTDVPTYQTTTVNSLVFMSTATAPAIVQTSMPTYKIVSFNSFYNLQTSAQFTMPVIQSAVMAVQTMTNSLNSLVTFALQAATSVDVLAQSAFSDLNILASAFSTAPYILPVLTSLSYISVINDLIATFIPSQTSTLVYPLSVLQGGMSQMAVALSQLGTLLNAIAPGAQPLIGYNASSIYGFAQTQLSAAQQIYTDISSYTNELQTLMSGASSAINWPFTSNSNLAAAYTSYLNAAYVSISTASAMEFSLLSSADSLYSNYVTVTAI